MDFSYSAYRDLLNSLRRSGYAYTDYHTYQEHPRCVILRHDIDQSLSDALTLARIEAEEGICSTWFVLLRTDFYNVASASSQKILREMQNLGHEIGLHFDEIGYGRPLTKEEVIQNIIKECGLLSTLLDTRVSTVSMHRPSKTTLEADLQIPGIVNSYGQTFFHDFKYLSDSRCNWREPVEEIIRSGAYDRLHILTHAFWYHDEEQAIGQTVGDFIRSANSERYAQMMDNITDLSSILGEDIWHEK